MTIQGREPKTTAKSTLSNVIGIVAGLVGALFALVTLDTPALKILGLLTCVTIAAVMLQAAHDREQGRLSNGMLWWLSTAGVITLTLVVFLATNTKGYATSSGSNQTPSGQIDSGARNSDTGAPTSTENPDASHTASPIPGPKKTSPYLVDSQAVGSADGWSTKPVQVKGVVYNKALSSTPCYSTSRLDYVLGVRFSRFQAMVGIADDSPSTTPLDFSVFADEKRVKVVESVGVGAPQTVDIPVAGVSRLSIRIELSGYCPRTVGVWIDPQVT
jgi:hypothetical protein